MERRRKIEGMNRLALLVYIAEGAQSESFVQAVLQARMTASCPTMTALGLSLALLDLF